MFGKKKAPAETTDATKVTVTKDIERSFGKHQVTITLKDGRFHRASFYAPGNYHSFAANELPDYLAAMRWLEETVTTAASTGPDANTDVSRTLDKGQT